MNEYKLRSTSIFALQFDGTEKMAKKICDECEYSYIEYNGSEFERLFCYNSFSRILGTNLYGVAIGDYLILQQNDNHYYYIYEHKNTFERKYQKINHLYEICDDCGNQVTSKECFVKCGFSKCLEIFEYH